MTGVKYCKSWIKRVLLYKVIDLRQSYYRMTYIVFRTNRYKAT
jgi:hypothetical protein